jgi:hypothetical protein
MKKVFIILAVLCLIGVTQAGELTATKDVADFSHVFTGTEIHDGTSYQNGWAQFSTGTSVTLTDLGGGILNHTAVGRGEMFNGSASTNGTSTWADDVNAGGDLATPGLCAYTIEMKIRVNALPNGYRIWGGFGDGRDFFDIYSDGVIITQPGGGFLTVPMTLNDGEFHTFRLVNDGNLSSDTFTLAHFFVDGVALSEPVGNPLTSGTNDARLLFGDSTSQVFGDDANYDIAYFAYDQSGAYAPLSSVPYNPDPSNGETDVEVDLLARDVPGAVSWAAPDAYTGATYDVYFGATEPNLNDPAPYGLTQIGTAGQAATSAAPSLPLLNDTPYYWVVDTYEPNDVGTQVPTFHAGAAWSFTTITALPVIDTQPLSKTAASADLVIEATNAETYEWYQVGTPDALVQSTTTTDPTNTYTTSVEGYYYCLVKNAALPAGLQSDVVRVMNPRLVGHWELDGDLTDSSVAGIWDGDYVDPNTALSNPDDSLVDYVTGVDGIGSAVKFNGYNLVEIPDSNEFFYFHKQGLTLTAWILGPSSGDWKRPVDTDNYGIVQHDSNSINVIVSDTGGWKTVVPSAEGSEGKWRFVAITYEPNDLDPSNGERVDYGIYDDDDLIDVLHRTVYATGIPGGSISQNLSIGGSSLDNPETPYNYDGTVDDVRVYNYALTSEQIQAIWAEMTDVPLCLTLDDPAVAPYDYNNDCKVTLDDFAVFVQSWLDSQLVSLP